MNYVTKEQLQELTSYIASQINVPTIGIGGGYAPIGSINFFDATVAPQDWLACDGTVYNIVDYPQLADWYESQHGSKNFYGGNGVTTFAVPDLQGEFLRGTGTNGHTNQGSGGNVGVHQDGTEIPYFGTYSANTPLIYMGAMNGSNDVLSNGMNPDSTVGSARGAYVKGAYDSTFSKGYTSRPTNTSFLICVKAVVAGDVYSTEERVVGTWIDGKKLYQRTVKSTNALVVGENTIGTITDFAELVSTNLVIRNSTGVYYSDNNLGGNNVSTAVYISNGRILINATTAWSTPIIYVTLQYTKTTD